MKRLFFLYLLLPCSLMAQGPFDGYMKGKGVLDFAPSFSFNSAEKFEGKDEVFDVPFRGNTLGVFAEYGITDKLDAIATGAMVFTSTQSGLQDGGLYLKYRPVYKVFESNHKLGILFASGIGFPMSDYDPIATGALGQKAVTVPFRAIAQWETAWGPFVNITGGYTARLDELDQGAIDQILMENPNFEPVDPAPYTTVMLRVGLPAAKYYLDAWVEWQRTDGGADFVEGVPDLPQAYGVDYTQIGGTAYYSENGRQGVLVSGGYIFKGRNTSHTLRMTVGAVFKLGVKQ